jgi:hypothetical protein
MPGAAGCEPRCVRAVCHLFSFCGDPKKEINKLNKYIDKICSTFYLCGGSDTLRETVANREETSSMCGCTSLSRGIMCAYFAILGVLWRVAFALWRRKTVSQSAKIIKCRALLFIFLVVFFFGGASQF